jgi:PAS domain S-box-containing protein
MTTEVAIRKNSGGSPSERDLPAECGNDRLELAVPICLKAASARAVAMQEKTNSPAKKPEDGQINKAPPKPPVQAHQTTHYFVELVLVFVACFLGGRVGLAIPFTSGNVSPVWPPAGIAMAAMFVVGYRIWPAVAIAAFLVNFFTPIPHVAALGIAVGNTVGPLAGIWLLRRIPRFHPSLTRLRDVFGLIVFAALGGTAISATLGTSILYLAHVNAWLNFGAAWRIWWLGDAMGVLIITPLVLTARGLLSIRPSRQMLKLAGTLLGTVISCLLIFDRRLGFQAGGDVFAFGVFPFVVWGAIQFEATGAAAVSFLISVVAVWETAHGFGPFVKSASLQNATLLQSFLAVISMSGMTLAALTAERAQLIRERTAREGLEQSEKRYRGIVETASEGMWKLDAEFMTCFVNRRMAELLGYTVDEMLGKPLFDFIFEGDVEQKRADLQRRRTGVSEQLERRYRKKDGAELWTKVSASPIFDDDGTFSGCLQMVSDMTDQKRAETGRQSAMETVMLLSRAMEQTADSVVITDREGLIEYVNPAFEATTGYSREEALGKTPRILKSGKHDWDFYKMLWASILEGQPFRGTLVNRKKTGELYWAEQTITPIKDHAGNITHFVSVLKDVTELRKNQEQEVQLRLAREVQQRFYAIVPSSVPGLDIAAAAYPMKETGGDYFDFFTMPDSSVCVGIGDVSGHGFDSALVMALTRAYVRSFAEVESDVGEILTKVNRMLVADLRDERFVTLLLVRLDTSNGSLAYASAGHVPAFLLDGSGEVDAVMGSIGPPLGLLGDVKFVSTVLPVEAHQLLLLLTDGITETTTSEDVQFGPDRALDYVRAHRQDSAQQIAEGICQAARCFAGGEHQLDDLTSVVVKVD